MIHPVVEQHCCETLMRDLMAVLQDVPIRTPYLGWITSIHQRFMVNLGLVCQYESTVTSYQDDPSH